MCIVVCTVNGESTVTSSGISHTAAAVTSASTAVSNGALKYDSQHQQQQHSNAVSNDVTAEVSDALYVYCVSKVST